MPIWECMVYDNFMIPRKNSSYPSPRRRPSGFGEVVIRHFSFRYESQPKKDVPSSDLTFSGHTNLSLGDFVSSFV